MTTKSLFRFVVIKLHFQPITSLVGNNLNEKGIGTNKRILNDAIKNTDFSNTRLWDFEQLKYKNNNCTTKEINFACYLFSIDWLWQIDKNILCLNEVDYLKHKKNENKISSLNYE